MAFVLGQNKTIPQLPSHQIKFNLPASGSLRQLHHIQKNQSKENSYIAKHCHSIFHRQKMPREYRARGTSLDTHGTKGTLLDTQETP